MEEIKNFNIFFKKGIKWQNFWVLIWLWKIQIEGKIWQKILFIIFAFIPFLIIAFVVDLIIFIFWCLWKLLEYAGKNYDKRKNVRIKHGVKERSKEFNKRLPRFFFRIAGTIFIVFFLIIIIFRFREVADLILQLFDYLINTSKHLNNG